MTTLSRRHSPYSVNVLRDEHRVFPYPDTFIGRNHGPFMNGPFATFRFVPLADTLPLSPPRAAGDSESLFVGGIPAGSTAEYLRQLFAAVVGDVALLSFDLVPNQRRSQANSGAARISVSAADAALLGKAFAAYSVLVDVGGAWVARTDEQREAMREFVALRRVPGLGHVNLLPMHCVTVEASKSQRRTDTVR
jgi:hypothetical protein